MIPGLNIFLLIYSSPFASSCV